MPSSVIFMGTPDFAVPSLEALLADPERFVVRAVVTQPDRPSGRGRQLAAPPVKQTALAHGVPVLQPERLRTAEAWEAIGALEADFVVVAAYGQILGKRYLELARLGPINVHASLLPRYRGSAPIHWSVVRGEAQTGISIMRMEAGLDSGPVYSRRVVDISEQDTAATLHDRMASVGAELLVETLPRIASGELAPQLQDESAVTWAPMLKKADGALAFDEPVRAIHDRARGMTPWPGAFCRFRGKLLKVLETRIVDRDAHTDAAPGTLLGLTADGSLLQVVCGGGGILGIAQLQLEGRKAQGAAEFVNGYAPQPGESLDVDPLRAERGE